MNENTSAAAVPAKDNSDQRLWPVATVMGTGIFATTFVQIQGLGYQPINHILEQMGLDSNQAATFMTWTILPWTLKGFAGLLVDGCPLLGSRRRAYLLASAFTGSLLWLAMGLYPKSYGLLLASCIGMSLALVFGGTASGGLLVEAGQRFGVTGRLSSVRVFAQNFGAAIGGWLGGQLAEKALGWTCAAALLPLSCMFIFAWVLLKEPPAPPRNPDFFKSVGRQLKNVLRWEILVPALLIFFIQAVPTFRSTSLYQYQTKVLNYDDKALGWLTLAGYGAALLSSGVYAWWCRRFSLRISLFFTVFLTSLSALPYLYYTAYTPGMPRTYLIESTGYFLLYLGYLPLFDLAARTTPKGSEALGYSLMLSVWNLGLMAGGKMGPMLYEGILHKNMNQLIWLNAIITLAGLVLVWLIPRALVANRDGKHPPTEEVVMPRTQVVEEI